MATVRADNGTEVALTVVAALVLAVVGALLVACGLALWSAPAGLVVAPPT